MLLLLLLLLLVVVGRRVVLHSAAWRICPPAAALPACMCMGEQCG